MPRPPAPIHNLRNNETNRSPRHCIFLDTETRYHFADGGEHHTIRLWSANFVHRHQNQHRHGNHDHAKGTTAQELADTLDKFGRHDRSSWVFIHKSGFDLGVTRLPVLLGRMGWKMGDSALASPNPWLRMSVKGHTLTFVDSASYLPKSIEQLGLAIGCDKLPLPAQDAPDYEWQARCDQDVLILECAMLQLMDWWDANKLGCWSVTGAACGWNTMRHRPNRDKVLIDPDPVARKFERGAVYGGRREAYRVGELPFDHYTELDFHQAHLTICSEMPLPCRRSVAFIGEPSASDWMDPDDFGIMAEVTVRTESPRYPCRIDERLWYPVGEFRTTLCDPELREAMARGEIVEWHHGYKYWLSRHMADWAKWCEGLLEDRSGATPPTAQIAAKAWSKSVPGKWATRTSRETETLPSDVRGWAIETGIDHEFDAPLTIVHMDGIQTWYVGDQEGDDSFPAVLAWIQSYTRVRLGRFIDRLPAKKLVSCNTDGLIIGTTYRAGPAMRAADLWPLEPRKKATYHNIEVKGPNHLILDSEPRLSGVPRAGALKWDDHYSWLTWPSLKSVLEDGSTEGYTRKARRIDLGNVPVNRWVLADGRTRPVVTRVDSAGNTQLIPHCELEFPYSGEALALKQHPSLVVECAECASARGSSCGTESRAG